MTSTYEHALGDLISGSAVKVLVQSSSTSSSGIVQDIQASLGSCLYTHDSSNVTESPLVSSHDVAATEAETNGLPLAVLRLTCLIILPSPRPILSTSFTIEGSNHDTKHSSPRDHAYPLFLWLSSGASLLKNWPLPRATSYDSSVASI